MARANTSPQQLGCEKLVELKGDLLEGPCWDARTGELLLVDIINGAIFNLNWSTGDATSVRVGESVSAVVPRGSGGYVVACRRGVATIDQRGDLQVLVPIEDDRRWTRSNDAKCDPAGRLWVGTMADDERDEAGSLYRVSADLTCTTVLTGVTISNGLGWSPGGERMYYIDSPTRRVDVFDFDMVSGEAVDRRRLIDTSEYAGLPDGMSVDSDGCLWVAFYGGSAVRRFAPDGTFLAAVDVPTPHVTSCTFAGPDLDRLVITTARAADINAREPGGDVYVSRPGVSGLSTAIFAG